jgi:microcystin degradation protein MlrC
MNLRIGYGRLFHEACAYSPILTEKSDFERMHHLEGDALERATNLRGEELASFMPHAELTGFRQAARLAGGVECVPLQSSLAVPSGPLSAACFEELVRGLEQKIASAGRLDGVYLALHGSMQVEGLIGAPEAEILRRVRAAVGPQAKIAVSYDLHGNLTPGLVEDTTVMVAYRSNPHWDLAPTGYRAGRELIAALRGKTGPVHAWRKLPMVLGGGTTIDFLAPMRGVFRFMKGLERQDKVLTSSLFMVHPFTASEELGWAVHVATNGDRDLANRLADALAERAWEVRKVDMPRSYSVDEAIDEAASSAWRKLGPITFVDGDDIVGAGAPGGNTHIVQALARDARGLRALVPVHDPALVEQLWNVPIGARREVTLRGTPGYRQPEVGLSATVAARTNGEYGRIVRLDVNGFHVAVSERPPLPIHPSFWERLDLRPRDADVMVQKNFFHYRMFHLTTSFRHLLVHSDGATSLKRVRERKQRFPTHPRDHVESWRGFSASI